MRKVPVLLGVVPLLAVSAAFARGPAPSHTQSDMAYALDSRSQEDPTLSTSSLVVATRPVAEVPIDRADGGLWVKAVINGRVTARMLLDTGSSVVIIPSGIAADIGLERDEGHPRRLNTIQGTVTGRLVTLDEVALGNAKVNSIDAVVLEDTGGEAIGLLGRSFLEHFTFQVDFDRNILTLIPRGEGGDLAADDKAAIEKRLETLQREQARAWMDGNSSPEYLEYLRRSVDYWASRRARTN